MPLSGIAIAEMLNLKEKDTVVEEVGGSNLKRICTAKEACES